MSIGNKAVYKLTHAHSTPVTTSGYTEIEDVTTDDAICVEIFDSSGETLVLAFGAAGSEVDQIYIMPGGNGRIPLLIPEGIRLSVKAVTANTASGNLYINAYL